MITSLYPVLLTAAVTKTADFYRERLAFDTTFESDWYVSLRRDGFELAVLDATHETIPPSHRRPSDGVIVNLEVDDVDAEYQRLVVDAGLEPLLDIRSESFGQRHFILAGPDGVAIDIISPIAPDEEFAAQYSVGAPTRM